MTGFYPPDAEDLAFEVLRPLALTTAHALDKVDTAVRNERAVMDPLRAGFGPTLRAGLHGLGRFGYAVREVDLAWAPIPSVTRVSTAQQEASNIFVWSVGDRYLVRIKHEPADEVAAGTQRLFSQLPKLNCPTTVFLTWDVGSAGVITAPRFVCIDEPKWTLTLSRLVAADVPQAVRVPVPRRTPIVRSKASTEKKHSDSL